MKEIFDRRYPVTSFFLLVTTLVYHVSNQWFQLLSAATLHQFGAIYSPCYQGYA